MIYLLNRAMTNQSHQDVLEARKRIMMKHHQRRNRGRKRVSPKSSF